MKARAGKKSSGRFATPNHVHLYIHIHLHLSSYSSRNILEITNIFFTQLIHHPLPTPYSQLSLTYPNLPNRHFGFALILVFLPRVLSSPSGMPLHPPDWFSCPLFRSLLLALHSVSCAVMLLRQGRNGAIRAAGLRDRLGRELGGRSSPSIPLPLDDDDALCLVRILDFAYLVPRTSRTVLQREI